jgi:ribulose-phosphate 3-epimerase
MAAGGEIMATGTRVTIGPSILTADLLKLGDEIRAAEAAGVDFIHLDVMDGRFVPNISFGMPICAAIRTATSLPIDVHLMIEEPEKYIDQFAAAGANRITVHVEASLHLHRTLTRIAELGVMPGVSLVPSTPVASIAEVIPFCGQILVMLVNPGFGGQSLIPSMLDKVQRTRQLIDLKQPDCLLEVDGGVNASTIAQVIAAGADTIVAGSAIFNEAEPVDAAVAALRRVIGG